MVLLASAFPLWWSFVIGSKDSAAIVQDPYSFIPGGHFFQNAATVVTTVPFWKALGNSILVSSTVALLVVLFSALAGFAFAKLRFRGRNGLLVFVIATMAVPTQLGIVPLFIVMSKLGWIGSLWAVIVPSAGQRVRCLLDDAVPPGGPARRAHRGLPRRRRVDAAHLLVGRAARRPARRGDARPVHLHRDVDELLLAVHHPRSRATRPCPVALQQLQAAYFVDYSLVLNGVVLMALPLIVLFVFAGKQLVSGIMQGAVKG